MLEKTRKERVPWSLQKEFWPNDTVVLAQHLLFRRANVAALTMNSSCGSPINVPGAPHPQAVLSGEQTPEHPLLWDPSLTHGASTPPRN